MCRIDMNYFLWLSDFRLVPSFTTRFELQTNILRCICFFCFFLKIILRVFSFFFFCCHRQFYYLDIHNFPFSRDEPLLQSSHIWQIARSTLKLFLFQLFFLSFVRSKKKKRNLFVRFAFTAYEFFFFFF